MAALSVLMLVSACGKIRESRLNPFNWFGRSEVVQTAAPAKAEDGRPMVQQVLSMSVEPMQGGAIVRATGLPPTQGWWDGELVAREMGDDGAMIYDFRLVPPLQPGRRINPKVTSGDGGRIPVEPPAGDDPADHRSGRHECQVQPALRFACDSLAKGLNWLGL